MNPKGSFQHCPSLRLFNLHSGSYDCMKSSTSCD